MLQPDAHDITMDTFQRLDLPDRGVHLPFLHHVGQQDNGGLINAGRRFFLQDRFDTDTAVTENTGHFSHHARLVRHLHAQVVRCFNVIHGQHRDISNGIRLKSEMWYPVTRITTQGAHDIHDICYHGRGRRLRTGAGTVIQGRTNCIGIHQYRVHNAINIGNQAAFRNQCGMHTHFDSLLRAPCVTQVLDAITECLGIGHILAGNTTDTLRVNLVELQRDTESDGCQYGELVRCVYTLNIEGGVGLGITQCLRLFQHIGKVTSLVAHLGEDKVAGAVDNTGEPLDSIG